MSDVVSPLKAPRASEHFVDDAAEGPDVGAAIDALAPRLLRRHIRRRAQQYARARRGSAQRGRVLQFLFGGLAFQRLRQAKVQEFDLALRCQLYVRGLQIAMNDAALMGVFKPVGNLLCKGQSFLKGNRPLADALGEALDLLPVPSPVHELRSILRGRKSKQCWDD